MAEIVPIIREPLTVSLPQLTRAQRIEARQQRIAARNARAALRPQGKQRVPDTRPHPPLLFNREGREVYLENHWYGAPLFLCLSGPSLARLPLEQLHSRGVVTMAVNNAATVVRPHLWTFVDPCEKFHEAIWRDPGIMKFMPVNRFGETVRGLTDNGLALTDQLCRECPNVFGYKRGANFVPERFLGEAEINWGNSKRNLANGQPHVLNVMFAALKIGYYLGFRTVYLLGCDFAMNHHAPAYCFAESKHAAAVDSNNGTYCKLRGMFAKLKPVFDAAGYRVFNCNPTSGLTVFPFKDFADALRESAGGCFAPHNVRRTHGYYTKESDTPDPDAAER